jgi:NADH-quinone oxidoreductase subunit M
MPNSDPLLLILILAPLLGAIILLCLPKKASAAGAMIGFMAALLPVGITIAAFADFDFLNAGTAQFEFSRDWLKESIGMQLSIGVDSLSLWLIALVVVMTAAAMLASLNSIKDRAAEFYAWILVLEAAMLGVFVSRDLLLFYLCFEATLVPMFFLLGIWGGAERRKAAAKFFLYTFSGSIFMLAAIVYLSYLAYAGYAGHGVALAGSGHFSFAYGDLTDFAHSLPKQVQMLIFSGFLIGFAVKIPLFPLHTWLPLAYSEGPSAAPVLSAVLVKLGTYGLIRLAIPMLPEATRFFAPIIGTLCLISILYCALIAWVQSDMRKLIGYSSISHMGFCVLGMFALTPEGLQGSILYMLNHGLSTGALFLVVGMIVQRYHTAQLADMQGLARRLPALAFFAIFFALSSIALPGLNGFVSEFLVLLGTFISGSANHPGPLGPRFAVVAAIGMVLGAIYMLYWAGKIWFGPLQEPVVSDEAGEGVAAPVQDINGREWAVLAPLAILVLILGLYPQPVLESLMAPVNTIRTLSLGGRIEPAPVIVKTPGTPIELAASMKQSLTVAAR